MNSYARLISVFFVCGLVSAMAQPAYEKMHHYINISLHIEDGSIQLSDTLLIPDIIWNKAAEHNFRLNSKLEITSTGKNTHIEKSKSSENGYTTIYSIRSLDRIKDIPALILSYAGNINEGFEDEAAEYARGFKQTNGIVSDTGVYLAGSTYWLPTLNTESLYTFTLRAEIPRGWSIVSEGKRILDKTGKELRHITYLCPHPLDEAYLTANRWTEYDTIFEKTQIQAFLINADKELASKYLLATRDYMQLYNKLIGPYPYSKFALVENFWETGYGMPSFTLLGSQVIRFPWILYSSYPHELLHNYWGNGVFVDPSLGNWCEGITAYMADHLFKEQRGQGDAYRQATLEKYTNYVNEGNDFPIKEFVNRNNPAQEAVGYGKVLMMNHMLRCMLGDETFLKAYRMFYKHNRFTQAGFEQIRASFEAAGNTDLKWFFDQWVQRKGAPELQLSDVSVSRSTDIKTHQTGFVLNFKIAQIQQEDVFRMDIPVEVFTDNDTGITKKVFTLSEREHSFSIALEKRPLRIAIDPHFDLMRKLDKTEVAPTLSQLFGQKEALIVLPSKSKHLQAYKKLAALWKNNQERQGYHTHIIRDDELSSLPRDKGVWIIGYDNKFNSMSSFISQYNDMLSPEQKNAIASLEKNGALVYVIPHVKNQGIPIGFLAANQDDVIEGLSHRLLHYGKYSLLGFEGKDGKNILKTVLPALHSSLVYDIAYKGYSGKIIAKNKPRKALSTLAGY